MSLSPTRWFISEARDRRSAARPFQTPQPLRHKKSIIVRQANSLLRDPAMPTKRPMDEPVLSHDCCAWILEYPFGPFPSGKAWPVEQRHSPNPSPSSRHQEQTFSFASKKIPRIVTTCRSLPVLPPPSLVYIHCSLLHLVRASLFCFLLFRLLQHATTRLLTTYPPARDT